MTSTTSTPSGQLMLFGSHEQRGRKMADEMSEDPSFLTVAQVKALIDRGERVLFLDSCNPIAWGSSRVKIAGALRIPIDRGDQHLATLPRDRRLVVYCT